MPKSYIILDSGVLLSTVKTEPYTPQAKALLKRIVEQQHYMAAPHLLRYEMVAVTRKWVYRELATSAEAEQALDRLLSYSVELFFDKALLKRAYELATEYNRPTAYDTQYLALAERLDCAFWTTDQRLHNAVKAKSPKVQWLGSITSDDDNE